MTREQFISIFFIALLVFVVYEVFKVFTPFLKAIFWAGIISFAFHPLYQKLYRLLKRRTFAAAIMTALVFLLVIPPVAFLMLKLAEQAIQLYQLMLEFMREGGLEKLIDHLRTYVWIQNLEEKLLQWDPIKQQASEMIANTARTVGNFGARQAGALTRNTLFIILNIFLTYVLAFVFFRDGERIYQFIYNIAPFESKNKKFIFNQINETFSAVIRGQLVTSLIQALIAGLAFWVLGLPVPIFFAAVTFLASLIPVVGASFIWFPMVIYLAIQASYGKAFALFCLGALGISLIDNLVKPALIGEKTKLPYFLLFFGVMGGMKVYGLMGIFLAPVFLSLFFALVKIYQQKYLPTD